MVYRTATMLAAITLAMYATGWGPTLAVGYGYAQTVCAEKKMLAVRANHDSLTQLPNRTAFLDRLEPALSAGREHSTTVAVLFLDVDSFKTVNDTLGHAVGDRLLTEVAARVRSAIRPGDMVARFGGDEFTVLLENVRNIDEAPLVAARITDVMRSPMQLESHELSVTVSIGIGMETDGEIDADELLRDADLAMYVAKKARRTRPEQPSAQSVSSSQPS